MVRAFVGDSTITSFFPADLLNQPPSLSVQRTVRGNCPGGRTRYCAACHATALIISTGALLSSSGPTACGTSHLAVGDGAAERHLVGVFEVTAYRQAVGDTGHRNVRVPEQFGQVHRGRFPFHRGGGGKDDFADVPEAGEEQPELQLFGPTPFMGER